MLCALGRFSSSIATFHVSIHALGRVDILEKCGSEKRVERPSGGGVVVVQMFSSIRVYAGAAT